MKRILLTSMLVTLSFGVAACAHYDPKRPNFEKNKNNTEPNFDSDGKKLTPEDGGLNSNESSSTPARTANPMTGPGMEATVPLPTMGETLPEPLPTPTPTPTPKPKGPGTYSEALAAIDAAKQKDPNLQKYFVGAGYDMLKGERMSVCLDPSSLRTLVSESAEVTDNYSVSHEYRDLYNKLETEFGADIGGIWQIFSGKLSFKTKIANENRVATDDVIVLASFTQLRNKITLLTPATEYSPFFRSTGIRDKELFRKYCGDKFTKEVSLGASMHLVFTAKKTDTTTRKATDVNVAIEAGLMGILSVGTSVGVSKEQREILKGYSFSVKCYTLGATPGVCGNEGIASTFNIDSDMKNFQRKVDNIRKQMVNEVKAGKNLVVVRETLADYEVPSPKDENDDELANVKRWDFFVDYRDRVAKLKRMSLDLSEADELCNVTNFWPRRCARVRDLLKTAIEECTSFSSNCAIPNEKEFQTLLTARGPGWVSLYKDGAFKGSEWTIDLRNLARSNIQVNKFYPFGEIDLGGANDRPTSLRSNLKNNWTVKFYQHPKENDAGKVFEVRGVNDYSNIGNTFNDSFSAFRLEPVGDL